MVANSTGATLERKSDDIWSGIEKIPASEMKARIYILRTAKPAENGTTYDVEIIHKDAVSVFQKTPQGLIRHKNIQSSGKNIVSLSDQVGIGKKVSIRKTISG